MIDTTSTGALITSLRDYILDYLPSVNGMAQIDSESAAWLSIAQAAAAPIFGTGPDASVGTVRAALDGRLYESQAPDVPAYPYGVMRLVNGVGLAETNGQKMTVDLEVQLFHRPRRYTMDLEAVADRIDRAMVRLMSAYNGGLTYSKQRMRSKLPPYAEPADREVVQIHLVYPLSLWPRYITDYTRCDAPPRPFTMSGATIIQAAAMSIFEAASHPS